MPFVAWTDELHVPIPAINEQHKSLLRIMNNLADEMRAQNGRDGLGKALDELVDYTRYHFRFEENLIRELAPRHMVEHMQEHQTLITRLNDLKQKYDASKSGVISIEALQFLRSWLVGHIAGSDKKVLGVAAASRSFAGGR